MHHTQQRRCGVFLDTKALLLTSHFPAFDPELAKEDLVTIAIQVNGKMRGKLEVEKEISKEDFFAKAKAEPGVAKFMEGKNVVKEIFVPGKICNFVVK